MKALFTAAALLATLAAPAAFAGTRDNPHPIKEATTTGGTTTAPAKKTTGKAAPTAGTATPAAKPAAKTN